MGQLTIETSMGGWKSILATIIAVNVESTEAIHTLELLEAI